MRWCELRTVGHINEIDFRMALQPPWISDLPRIKRTGRGDWNSMMHSWRGIGVVSGDECAGELRFRSPSVVCKRCYPRLQARMSQIGQDVGPVLFDTCLCPKWSTPKKRRWTFRHKSPTFTVCVWDVLSFIIFLGFGWDQSPNPESHVSVGICQICPNLG